MLNDENKLDFINPFQTNGPGSWSNPHAFAPAAAAHPGKGGVFDAPDDVSPMYLADISVGSPRGQCFLHRPLEPTREIEPDAGTGSLDALYGNFVIPKDKNPTLVPRYCDTADGGGCAKKGVAGGHHWVFVLLFIALAVLAFRKSIF